eukprot:1593827-Rhodomonas_salina.1
MHRLSAHMDTSVLPHPRENLEALKGAQNEQGNTRAGVGVVVRVELLLLIQPPLQLAHLPLRLLVRRATHRQRPSAQIVCFR